ncbi:unnamed protein product [Caenorhabditis nigoni]
MNTETDVLVLERVEFSCSPYSCHVPFPFFFDFFKVRKLNNLKNDRYETISINSVIGQPYKNFESRVLRNPTIAYHIITPPKNFENLKNKDFHPGCYGKKGHRTSGHWRRSKNMVEIILEAKYDRFEDANDDLIDAFLITEERKLPRKYYNLEDHILESYVYIKRKSRTTRILYFKNVCF